MSCSFARTIATLCAWMIAAQMAGSGSAAGASPPPRASIDFDASHGVNSEELFESKTSPQGRRGEALELGHADNPMELRHPISSREGTVAFWVKPGWEQPRKAVQPLVSASWNSAQKDYLVISQGWWEPLGSARLYFVVSNQDALHCSAKYELDVGVWTSITAVWRDASCALFIDGVRVAGSTVAGSRTPRTQTRIHLGTDAAVHGPSIRATAGLMDDLTLFSAALTDRQVGQLYEDALGGRQSALRHRWDWLRRETARTGTMAADDSREQLRAIFDESWQWAQSRRTVDGIVERARAAGFNLIVPCVWHGAGTYYPSAHPAASLRHVLEGGFDPLAYLIERAHASGLKVHPWFTVVRREDDALPQFSGDGVPAGAFDVHSEAFRDFIVALVVDVARRYPIDGINLDYIRAMGICRSARCAEQYHRETGRVLGADLQHSQQPGAARNALEGWQDGAVSDIVNRISSGVRDARAGVPIGVDGHPTAAGEVRLLQGRNEIRWAQQGWVDIVFHMDYRHRPDLDTIDAVIEEMPASTRHVVLLANYDLVEGTAYARPGWVMADLVRFARKRWPRSGIGVHLMGMLDSSQVAELRAAQSADARNTRTTQ